ncbi:MAG: hypothetical protein BRC27_01080 [Nanohaloarchaea archaeon SW_10_44_10]|nr:MAG: hypothetical protein BRC27_01080 [Nanohaloarchaea archaeon SW_10_44_10]
MASHPLESEKEFKQALNEIKRINYTRHFEEERLPNRVNLNKKTIEENLNSPSNLIDFEFEEDEHSRPKYQLVFDKSNKYYLKVVISFKRNEVFIVTAHIVNKRRKELSQVFR